MQYIFLHGLGQNSSSWDKTVSFMGQSMEAVCPDLLVFLDNEAITYTNLYKAFSDYCKNISEPLNLCGLSLGGVLALNYAIDYPERVNSLVLIGAQYKMPKTILKLQNIIFRFMPESAFKNMGFQKKDFIQLTNSMMDLDFSKRLKEIPCATLVLCGGKDNANKKAAKGLAENIQRAEYKLVDDTSHEVNIENPQKLALELETFWLPFILEVKTNIRETNDLH